MIKPPIALFAYSRPQHLSRTLESLKANSVPLIYAFSDGPRVPEHEASVAQVREVLRGIDWCKVELCERNENMGLGRSIRTGVGEVLSRHDRVLVVEDDLICVPGTYDYLSAALEAYRDASHVMSVTGWTHRRVTPAGIGDGPYFDGRAECLFWGAWARSWEGMARDAGTMIRECEDRGIDIYEYGADLVDMAAQEAKRNIWAVRFLYHHILNRGICVRPPWSMVEHIGFDEGATNAKSDGGWSNGALEPAPPIPAFWPEPSLNPQCSALWRAVLGGRPTWSSRLKNHAKDIARPLIHRVRTLYSSIR